MAFVLAILCFQGLLTNSKYIRVHFPDLMAAVEGILLADRIRIILSLVNGEAQKFYNLK